MQKKENETMPEVEVQRIHSDERKSHPVVEHFKALTERIRQRAYELFERRAGSEGAALDDWLQAENDLLIVPGSDLIETDNRFELEIALAGFDAKDIEIDALPDALIVRANNIQEHEQTEGKGQAWEFGGKILFRRFELPTTIDVDKVTATLNKGLLKLTAPKAQKASADYAATAA